MSANNYILIEEIEPNKFVISHKDADTHKDWGKPRSANSLRKAIMVSQDMEMENYPVEYGVKIELKPETLENQPMIHSNWGLGKPKNA